MREATWTSTESRIVRQVRLPHIALNSINSYGHITTAKSGLQLKKLRHNGMFFLEYVEPFVALSQCSAGHTQRQVNIDFDIGWRKAHIEHA